MSELDDSPFTSPYAPPKADLQGAPSGSGQGRAGAYPLDPTKVDPARALMFPFQHPGWWKPALLLGLVYLVPIYGVVLMMGWIQKVYSGVRTGALDRLPDIDWGGDFTGGFRLMGSLLVGSLVWTFGIGTTVAVMVGMGVGLGAAGQEEAAGTALVLGTLLIQVPIIVLSIASYLVGGELGRRALSGDLFALLRWKRSIQVIAAHPIPYIVTMAGLVAALLATYLGLFACYFGIFVTMPIGAAMAAHVIAQWDRYLEHMGEPSR